MFFLTNSISASFRKVHYFTLKMSKLLMKIGFTLNLPAPVFKTDHVKDSNRSKYWRNVWGQSAEHCFLVLNISVPVFFLGDIYLHFFGSSILRRCSWQAALSTRVLTPNLFCCFVKAKAAQFEQSSFPLNSVLLFCLCRQMIIQQL